MLKAIAIRLKKGKKINQSHKGNGLSFYLL